MTPSDDHVDWADLPPEDKGTWIPIYSAKSGIAYELVALGGELVGVWTHYWRERTIPCVRTGPLECVCERVELARRWKGYIAGWEPRYSRRVLIEVSADALRLANFGPADVDGLRGRFLRLSRRGRTRNAPVVVEVTTASVTTDDLPPPFDIRAALCRVWESQARD